MSPTFGNWIVEWVVLRFRWHFEITKVSQNFAETFSNISLPSRAISLPRKILVAKLHILCSPIFFIFTKKNSDVWKTLQNFRKIQSLGYNFRKTFVLNFVETFSAATLRMRVNNCNSVTRAWNLNTCMGL